MEDQQDSSALQILVSADLCQFCTGHNVISSMRGDSFSATCTTKHTPCLPVIGAKSSHELSDGFSDQIA